LTTGDVGCVHHRWHGTHQYDIQVLATHASTWVHWYSLLLQWSVPTAIARSCGNGGTYTVRPTIATWPCWSKGMDHCSSEEYRCTHVDACLTRTWISYRLAPCHPWCTHPTSVVVKKNFFSFSVAVKNSFKVGPLV
jgi:hypothetical protein